MHDRGRAPQRLASFLIDRVASAGDPGLDARPGRRPAGRAGAAQRRSGAAARQVARRRDRARAERRDGGRGHRAIVARCGPCRPRSSTTRSPSSSSPACATRRTDRATFRQTTDTLSQILVYEAHPLGAHRGGRASTTPLGPTQGVRIDASRRWWCPVLRAGLGMLGAVLHLMPERRSVHRRRPQRGDASSPSPYMNSVPPTSTAARAGARPDAGHRRLDGARLPHPAPSATPAGSPCVCILSAPEGLARLEATGLDRRGRHRADRRATSTTSPTSSPASATPATASSAPPDPRSA